MASTSSDKEDWKTEIRDNSDKTDPGNDIEQPKLSCAIRSPGNLASSLESGLGAQVKQEQKEELDIDPQSCQQPSQNEGNEPSNNGRASSDTNVSSSEELILKHKVCPKYLKLIPSAVSSSTTTSNGFSHDQPCCSSGQNEGGASEANRAKENVSADLKVVYCKYSSWTKCGAQSDESDSNECKNSADSNSRTMYCVCGNPIGEQNERKSEVCVRLHNAFASICHDDENAKCSNEMNEEEDEEEESEQSDNYVHVPPCESVNPEQIIEFEQSNEAIIAVDEELEENGSWSPDNSQLKRSIDHEEESVNQSFSKKKCLTNCSANGLHSCTDVCGKKAQSGLLESLEKTPPASTINLKKRIPTKDNPPPELAQWLQVFHDWGNAERLLAIDELISLCNPTQVRHMMSVIEPQFQRDFISLLPKELALYVLSFLEPKDLLRAAQTCRYWRILAEDNLLWREKCREANVETVDLMYKRRANANSPSPSPWKAAYLRENNIELNWRYRPIRSPKVLKGHDDHVITCLQFSGTKIVSGSDDNTLKVWSAVTGKCLKTLIGHTGGVWSSQMAGNIIVSGSTDRTLKVWCADAGHCLHTLYGHTSTVRCMHLHKNKVVSGSRDASLRVWDIHTGECLHVLVGHLAAVRCVQYDGRLVVSGAYDYVVKVWNPDSEVCLHTLQGHTSRVYSLQFDGVHVVSGSLDTSIRVWDVETGMCKHTLVGHQSLTSGMELKNNILVSGNADSTVKVWNILTGKCLQTLSGANKHNSAVTCLQFNSKFVITSSDDGTVKLWDLKTGEFIRNLVALESGGSGGVVWRIRASPTKLVCAVGSRNGTEETKLLVLNFDVDVKS